MASYFSQMSFIHFTNIHASSTVVVTVEETKEGKIECFPSRWRWDLVAGAPEEQIDEWEELEKVRMRNKL